MDEAELRRRASEADRLLNHEPLLKEALDGISGSALIELLRTRGAEPEDDRKRRALIDRINAIDDLRTSLAHAIAAGLHAAQPDWA